MVFILPPSFSTTFLLSIFAPFIIGILIGIIIKNAIKVGAALLILILVLIALGILTPDQVLGWAVSLVKSGSAAAQKVQQIAGYLPYSSLTFLLGVALGFFKG